MIAIGIATHDRSSSALEVKPPLSRVSRIARELSPASTIVVGGHVSAIPGIEKMIDADEIVRGDGISWMRSYLGEPTDAPVRHPALAWALFVMEFLLPVVTAGILLFNVAHGATVTHAVAGGGNWGG